MLTLPVAVGMLPSNMRHFSTFCVSKMFFSGRRLLSAWYYNLTCLKSAATM